MDIGTQPHSHACARARRGNNNTPNGKLAIEAPPERTSSSLAPSSPLSPAPVEVLLLRAPGRLFDPLLPSTSSSASNSALALVPPTPSPSPAPTLHGNIDLGKSLDCVRIILAPVAERQRARAEQNGLEKRRLTSSPSSTSTLSASSACGDGVRNFCKGKAKPLPINIPLRGPRVEVVLAWLAGW